MNTEPSWVQRLGYAFDHLVSADAYPDDAHAGDSRDLGREVLDELGLSPREVDIVESLAEHVATQREEETHG